MKKMLKNSFSQVQGSKQGLMDTSHSNELVSKPWLGYSPYNGPVMFGTMSFEGSLLYLDSRWEENKLKSGDIRDIFAQLPQDCLIPLHKMFMCLVHSV